MGQPITDLFDGYYHDLARLGRLVANDVAGDTPAAAPDIALLEKLALETARLVVYEQWFLLPVLRRVVPDGQVAAHREARRLVPLLAAARRLEHLPPYDGALRRALGDLVMAVDELAEQRRSVVCPALIAALDDDTLTALGDRVTPTIAAGSTHSHPTEARRSAGTWPRPGFTDEMVAVFERTARARQPAVAPVHV